MDRKTIALVGICLALLIFWGPITQYLGLAPKRTEAPIVTPAPVDTTPAAIVDTVRAVPVVSRTPMAITAPVDTLTPEKRFTVVTPLYELTFSNYGGGLKKILLRQYTYHGHGNVLLADSEDKVVPDFETAAGAFRAGRLPFACDQSDLQLAAGSAPRKIVFMYENGRGGKIIKSYTVNPDKYTIDFDLAVEGIESFGFERSYRLVWDITPPPTEKNLKDDYGYFKVVANTDKHIELADFKDGVMNEEITGATGWAGLRTKYFAAVMIPRSRNADGFVARGRKQMEMTAGGSVETRTLSAGLEMPIPNYGAMGDSYTLYVGPIHYSMLKGLGLGLEELTSLGWVVIKPFSIAIIWLLPKIYTVIPNYGIVVLIFALLIKLITYPLTRKQTIAMTKMKDLQPKMKALQERHKQDPARMNKEVMKLYKEAGANPLSGCLPMLPQLPLFFALFSVFRTTIEFRGATFVGWISDLSTPDPYYILPVIMVIVMFVQQRMTPTDPKQKMMMYLFPLLFGWMSINFPAGLVLYWTGFSILSYLETVMIRRTQQPAVTVVNESP